MEEKKKKRVKDKRQLPRDTYLVLPHEVLFLVAMILREVADPTVVSLLFTNKALHLKLKATLPTPRMKGSIMDKHFFCELCVRGSNGEGREMATGAQKEGDVLPPDVG